MSLRTTISTLLFSASAAAGWLVGVHRETGVCKFSDGLGPSCSILGVTTIVIQISSCCGCEGLFLQVVAVFKRLIVRMLYGDFLGGSVVKKLPG